MESVRKLFLPIYAFMSLLKNSPMCTWYCITFILDKSMDRLLHKHLICYFIFLTVATCAVDAAYWPG